MQDNAANLLSSTNPEGYTGLTHRSSAVHQGMAHGLELYVA